jgi:hypothetical protein
LRTSGAKRIIKGVAVIASAIKKLVKKCFILKMIIHGFVGQLIG